MYFCCLDGESVLLKTLDYFMKSSTKFSVDSTMSGSDIFSPREREQLNRCVSNFLLSQQLIFIILHASYLLPTWYCSVAADADYCFLIIDSCFFLCLPNMSSFLCVLRVLAVFGLNATLIFSLIIMMMIIIIAIVITVTDCRSCCPKSCSYKLQNG